MSEMIEMCGRRFVVDRRAEKVCDTVNINFQSRRLAGTVFLDGGERCDGAGHGGCEAECRLYWNEAWLRRILPGAAPRQADDAEAVEKLRALVRLLRYGQRRIGPVPVSSHGARPCQHPDVGDRPPSVRAGGDEPET